MTTPRNRTREPSLEFVAPLTDHHPTAIGPYRILGVLGSGGMGTVYAAEQDQPHRTVALKVIRSEFASEDSLRRFARESEVLGRLQHPGIAQIFAAGSADGPYGAQPYFAMELVRGRTLTAYALAECRGTAQRLELFARVCDAVQYAHQKGVIHRDLKPANILVEATGQPKILDFGVARLTDGEVPNTLKTDVGVVVGTLQYMSPEQIAGDSLDVDTRSDIYALGVILYEMLSGKLPYTWKSGGIAEAAHVIITRDPPSLGTLDKAFRGDIETIVAKALEKDKARRYASAAGLANDVRRFLQFEPISARPASAAYQLRKLARRHRALVAGVAVAALALVAGTGVSLAMAVRARAAERLAEARRGEAVAASALAETRRGEAVAASALAETRRAEADSGRLVADAARVSADSARSAALRERAAAVASSERAEREAAKAVAVSSFLEDMLQSTNPDLTQGKNITIKDVVDRAARDLAGGRLAAQPAVRADLHLTLARAYLASGVYDSALTHADSAQALRQRTLGAGDAATIQAAMLGAKILIDLRNLPGAERRFTANLDAIRRLRPPRPDMEVDAMRRLAILAYFAEREAEADSLATASVALARSLQGNDSVRVGAIQGLAEIRTFIGRAKDAEPLWREVMEFNRGRYGERHTMTLDVGYGLAYSLFLQGKYREAEELLRPMVPVVRSVYGDHPTLGNVLERLGTAIVNQGRREEAEPLLREALAVRLKVLDEQHSDVQISRVSLGRVIQFIPGATPARYAEAESLFTAALRARTATLGPKHGAVASSTEDLAVLAQARGDLAEATRRFRAAIVIWREAGITVMEQSSVSRLANVLTLQGELDEAERLLVDLRPKQRATVGETHMEVANTTHRLAEVYRRRGRPADADSLHRQALDMRRRVYGPTSINLAASLEALAQVRELVGDTASAEPLVRELVEITRAVRPATDPTLLARQAWLGATQCASGKAAEGTSAAHAALTAAESATPPDTAAVGRARRAVAGCVGR